MDAKTRRKVSEMVLDLVKKANIEEATEFKIRLAASELLGIDLSDNTSKQFVGSIVQSYLVALAKEKSIDAEKKKEENVFVSSTDDDAEKNKNNHEDVVVASAAVTNEETEMAKVRREGVERVICQLSTRRNVAVKPFKGTTLVSIREFYMKDGKLLPGSKGISLSSEQWLTFKKSVPAIQEAISKMEGRIRPELKEKQNEDASNSVVNIASLEPVPTDGKKPVDVAPLKLVPTDGKNSVVDVAPLEPVIRFEVPIEVIRFDGKNYQFWARQMELLLKQLKIEYVLTECPNTALGEGASAEEIAAAKAAERRWVNDDLMCRHNILIHLSDHLFNLYANRKMSGKELWEELKLVYLYEEFGTKRSQVKKYIEFQMVDEKPVGEQIRELNNIADSITAAGMFIDDNFHVSVIISKLPPSWKDFCIKLMREEHLPFHKLMEWILTEEAIRNGIKRVGDHSSSMRFHPGNGGEQRRAEYKPQGMYRNRPEINPKSIPCTVCGRRGHLSKNCWRRHDRQVNERKAEEDLRIPSQVDTPGAATQ